MKYRIEETIVAYVEADSEEEAEEKYLDDPNQYYDHTDEHDIYFA